MTNVHELRSARPVPGAGPADPFPDAIGQHLPLVWHYLPGDLEAGILGRLVAESFSANKYVDYPDTYRRASAGVEFAAVATGGDLVLRASGGADVRLSTGERHIVRAGDDLPLSPAPGVRVEVVVSAPSHGAAAVAEVSDSLTWSVRGAPGAPWQPSVTAHGDDRPADAVPEPILQRPLEEIAPGLWAAPTVAVAHVVVHAEGEPQIVAGESRAEALAGGDDLESRMELVEISPGVWRSAHRLGVRFVRVIGQAADRVTMDAFVRPVARRGSFTCSDPRLSRIWDVSAYTLRTCMQVLLLDGAKRDRLPWAGDLVMAIPSVAVAFGDPAVLVRTLRALGPPRAGHVNGIVDYSLWWLIAHDELLQWFSVPDLARTQAADVHAFLTSLNDGADDDGLLRPGLEAESFPGAASGVFLDWGDHDERSPRSVALQILWWWALRAGSSVLAKAGWEAESERWRGQALRVAAELHARGRDAGRGVWLAEFDRDRPGYYATVLAALAGIDPVCGDEDVAGDDPGGDPDDERRLGLLSAGRPRTPFMRTFAMRSLIATGAGEGVAADVGREWGAMLDAGATTFWEEFPGDSDSGARADEPRHLAMYGRPFGRSLCHGWSSGPASLLPMAVLGLQPTAPGWETCSLAPRLGALAWARTSVPLEAGDLMVDVRRERPGRLVCELSIPTGVTVAVAMDAGAQRQVAGPCTVSVDLPDGGSSST